MITQVKAVAIKQIFSLLPKISDKNLIRMLSIAENYLISNEAAKNNARKIREAFEQKHPAVTLTKNTLGRLSANCKKKLIENFFMNAGIFGKEKLKESSEKLGFGLPWFFVISPTARCNLKCVGCYAGEYTKDDDLPIEEVDRLLTEAKELGIYFITISGGEPFLRKDLLDIFAKHNDMYFLVYTNGTMIDEELAKKLAELGNVAPGISIEGKEENTDKRRGAGVHKKVLQAMDNLRKHGVLFGYSATPSKLTSDVLMSDEFVDLMVEKGSAFGWYFQYVPIGRCPDVNLMSTPEQRNKLRLRIKELRKTKPLFIGDFWNDGPHVGGCIAGARPGGYFHINCKGDVEPCVFLHFAVDNIRKKKLAEVMQSDFFKALQKAQPYCANGNLLTPCALIDNPRVLRALVKKYNARPTHPGSDTVIKEQKIVKFLDSYSKEFKKITAPVWEKELKGNYKHWKEKMQCFGKKEELNEKGEFLP
ncbi:MAG: radical SAM protein [Nanoarchaeota archaeon]